MDAAELELFERSVRQATDRHTGDALDDALTELGWPDALADDPTTAVAALFPHQGAALATSRALEQVVTTGLDRASTRDAEAVVLPPLGSREPPGRLRDRRLSVCGLGRRALAGADRVLVVAIDDAGVTRTAIATTSELVVRTVAGLDPDGGWVEITADRVEAQVEPGPASWEAAAALSQLAVSAEILGVARTMLTLARDHALDRIQYGVPISRFQAVRHRLAEALVAVEAADAVLGAALEAPSPELAAVAKSLAGRGARTAARHCQQVLAGIGFTAEHPFHRHYRRVLLLDQLFGSAHALTAELGNQLLASRRLPALLPL